MVAAAAVVSLFVVDVRGGVANIVATGDDAMLGLVGDGVAACDGSEGRDGVADEEVEFEATTTGFCGDAVTIVVMVGVDDDTDIGIVRGCSHMEHTGANGLVLRNVQISHVHVPPLPLVLLLLLMVVLLFVFSV